MNATVYAASENCHGSATAGHPGGADVGSDADLDGGVGAYAEGLLEAPEVEAADRPWRQNWQEATTPSRGAAAGCCWACESERYARTWQKLRPRRFGSSSWNWTPTGACEAWPVALAPALVPDLGGDHLVDP